MNEGRRLLLKFLALIPAMIAQAVSGKQRSCNHGEVPTNYYEWNGSGTSTDPRMPVLGYGDEAPYIYFNGKLLSHTCVNGVLSKGIYITRCRSGQDGWVEHSLRDDKGSPILRRVWVEKTVEVPKKLQIGPDRILSYQPYPIPCTTQFNKHWKTYVAGDWDEILAVEKIFGRVEVVPRCPSPKPIVLYPDTHIPPTS